MVNFVVDVPPPKSSVLSGTKVYLAPQDWDDYNHETLFRLYVDLGTGGPKLVGSVKILAREYPSNILNKKRTRDVLEREFSTLIPEDFCSVGQDSGYYSRLGGLPDGLGRTILGALHDVALGSQTIDGWWRESRGYTKSLLRYNSANLAMRDAPALFRGDADPRDITHHLRYDKSSTIAFGGPSRLELSFDGGLPVPGRINVLVGKNGSGKTSLLAGMARWLRKGKSRGDDLAYRPDVSRVLIVSFNAFDTDYHVGKPWRESNVRFIGYRPASKSLLDLLAKAKHLADASQGAFDSSSTVDRRVTAPEQTGHGSATPEAESDHISERQAWSNLLMANFPMPSDFMQAMPSFGEAEGLSNLRDLRLDEEWQDFVSEAFDDPNVARRLVEEEPADVFSTMSAGQRVLALLVGGLYTHIDRQSMVLLDEPENHLHPSLVARFIRSLNKLLDLRKAFAVLATHSPIILQETPSRFVTVLKMQNGESVTSPAGFETFGESIDSITDRLFETDFRSSHWKSVLNQMARNGLGISDVEQRVSGQPLSLVARTFYAYQQRKVDEPK
jgi:predicted ATPase